MRDIEVGVLLLIDSEVWQIVGDYTEVATHYDYELRLVSNNDVWDMYSTKTIYDNIRESDWKLINVT